MSTIVSSTKVLSLLRHIPEEPLLAIVNQSEYATAIVTTHAPLPDAVFEYLFSRYPSFGRCGEWSSARRLSKLQRARVLSSSNPPLALESFFKYNVLTYPELLSLSRRRLTAASGLDLIRQHRADPIALGIIAELLPDNLAKRLGNMARKENVSPRSCQRISADELRSIASSLGHSLDESFLQNYPDFPIHNTLDVIFDLSSRSNDPWTRAPYDAAPLVAILGESPAAWLAFFAQLDTAGPLATPYQVAQTVRRARLALTA